MPHPQGRLKLSGDTHLPDAESDQPVENGRGPLAALAKERQARGRPGVAVRRAGLLRAQDETPAAAPEGGEAAG